MTALYYIFGITVFIWVYFFLRLSISTRLLVPIIGFLISIFLSALSNQLPIAVLAQLFRVFSLSFIIAELLRVPRIGLSGLFSFEPFRLAAMALLLLAFILLVHNVWDFEDLFNEKMKLLVRAVNPWGLFSNCLIALYLFRAIPNAYSLEKFHSQFAVIALCATFLLLIIMFMVEFGFIAGNTQKAALGIGGIGLANHSTNDTGLLATILLMWNIRYLTSRTANRILLLSSIILCFIVIILTKSRISLALSTVILFISILTSNVRFFRKLIIAVLLLTAVLPIVLVNVKARNDADYAGTMKSQIPIQKLPGSGRLLFWLYYADAFFYTSQQNPTQYLFGVGMLGLPDLYRLTPLSTSLFNISLDNIDYYPIHSDFVLTFLIAGVTGGIFWIFHFVFLLLSPKSPAYLFQFFSAFTILFSFSLFDMLIYSQLAIYLIYLALIECCTGRSNKFRQEPLSVL